MSSVLTRDWITHKMCGNTHKVRAYTQPNTEQNLLPKKWVSRILCQKFCQIKHIIFSMNGELRGNHLYTKESFPWKNVSPIWLIRTIFQTLAVNRLPAKLLLNFPFFIQTVDWKTRLTRNIWSDAKYLRIILMLFYCKTAKNLMSFCQKICWIFIGFERKAVKQFLFKDKNVL